MLITQSGKHDNSKSHSNKERAEGKQKVKEQQTGTRKNEKQINVLREDQKK